MDWIHCYRRSLIPIRSSLSLLWVIQCLHYGFVCPSAVFSKLHTLCLDYVITTTASLQPFLSRCPALEEIHFSTYDHPDHESVHQGLDTSDLPLLKVYYGPDFEAHHFTVGRPVLHVRFWGASSWNESREPDHLIPYLRGLRSISKLESLEFSVKHVTKDFLWEICHLFPHLKALAIVVDSKEHQNYGVYTREVLAIVHLSSHLLILLSKRFCWICYHPPVFHQRLNISVLPSISLGITKIFWLKTLVG